MITIAATTTAVPPYPLPRADVKQALQTAFRLNERRMASVMSIIDHAQVEQRYSVFPLEYVIQPRSLTQTTQEYQEHAIGLGRQVARDCLAQAGLQASEVDLIITVSCTGYMIPSLDA
jgi:predicted naringenin-chalcone synthase